MSRQLTIPTADTQLHTVDTPGGTPPLLFLNGGFGSLRNWDRVIQRLAGKYRTVRFDAGARGKSGTSADYSVRGAVDDISRVIESTGIQRPILVGWSHGATIAVRYAARHPEQVGGLVLIDGAYPIAMFDEAGKEKVRAQFRRPLGRHRGGDAHDARCRRRGRGKQQARVRVRDDALQPRADPGQGPRHRGRRDRGRHPPVFLTAFDHQGAGPPAQQAG